MISANEKKIILDALHISEEQFQEYPASYVVWEDSRFLLCKAAGAKRLIAAGKGDFFFSLEGEALTEALKICPLSHQNRLVLNHYLPYTLPVAFGTKFPTFGLGDRLGLASPGHIRAIERSRAKPVLAQQSKRELDLTGRTYEQVLDDACFAVFQEGYQGGFGADGDHLKKIEDIQEALNCGYTMITLDCSEKIGRGIETLSQEELETEYELLSQEYRMRVEASYLSKGFPIGEETCFFSRSELMQCSLIYRNAIDFTKEVYHNLLLTAGHPVDFELSIDETESVTTAQGHLFVAMELHVCQVTVTSLAPRFIGEFQKGIDYIGTSAEFESQLKLHAAIARQFGYKLSIHSGSDKFSIFPLIGKHTADNLHIKTSGTSWLEAIGTIAETNPLLYRNIHQKALINFEEAKKNYHVSGDPSRVENPTCKTDQALIGYLDDDNARQLLHITYGFVLGDPSLKKELYETLEKQENHYYQRLTTHIGRHLSFIHLME